MRTSKSRNKRVAKVETDFPRVLFSSQPKLHSGFWSKHKHPEIPQQKEKLHDIIQKHFKARYRTYLLIR